MPRGMLGLEHETCVFLIPLSRETHVVELNFVHSGVGSLLGEGDIVFLNLRLRGIGPYSFPFSRQGWPVLWDFTASSGCATTNRSSRKMATRAMACIPCECRKWVNLGRS